ncbi:MAG: tripartite tricarboxylate transporter substrate binding protein [Paracoccus sp. (in: a-proteobacteria)]|uniref:Bug family tripartite tricarboxylate transporter substrate binding protein n=1 Tax=Paracoccus sp. TaxID=267 RepID=UPI0026E032F0|nr:tripartite tricarboxylate transporter substrate binding protein [Paracoccus sp. (in: a-proteobacteria)]MDO5631612.1 tripartite tricarboxylate transporter substrate binding protein [Paracoccus sp. (in: a-proteobacteria)]
MFTYLLRGTAAFTFAALANMAVAQDFPGGSIEMIVPYPPGGGTDIPARLLTERITAQKGWNFVVQNQPGAGGNIGLAQVARTTPDGRHLGMGQTSNMAVNPALYPDIPYDPLTAFTPIALLTTQPMAIVTFPDSPYADFGEVIAAARANPGEILFGTPGNGTVAHLSIELLATEGDLDLTHVPYPGIAQAITDVMGGAVDIYIGSVPSVLPHIRAGSIRPLAVTSSEPNFILPDVPTVASFGFDGFDTADWKAVVGPAGIPAETVATLNAAINDALADDTLRSALEAEGSTILGGSPEEFAAYLAEQVKTWAEVVETSGASID